MPQVTTPLELYKLLPQTNCGRCYLPSCLAFAAEVIKGRKRAKDCPFATQALLDSLPGSVETRVPYELKREEELKELQKKVRAVDLFEKASSLGGRVVSDSIAIPCLGKEFFITPDGNVSSACHTHTGLTIPLLTYVLHPSSGKQGSLQGEWIAFRKLPHGLAMAPLFERKCEGTLKKIADAHPDLFEILVSLFSGDTSHNPRNADTALTLFPLPKIPLHICYWRPEDDLESMLRILFDAEAHHFLQSESIYSLVVGLVMMFEKIVQQHT